jgi:replication factor A1
MEIKDVQANQGNVDIVAQVSVKEDERTFEKFGKSGRVCSAMIKDATGEIKLTLWNDDVDSVKVGDKIHIQNGWCSEYQGEKQLSSGKFGKIEVVDAGPAEVLTNDPNMLPSALPEELQEQPVAEEEMLDEETVE